MREEIFLPTTRDRLRSRCTHHLSHCCMIGRIDRVVSAQVARLFGTNRTRRPASPLPSRWMFVDLEAVGKLHPTARDRYSVQRWNLVPRCFEIMDRRDKQNEG